MSTREGFRVPGEDLGWSVPAVLAAVGAACAAAAVSLTTSAMEPPPAPAASAPVPTAIAPAPAPSPAPAPTPAPSAAAATAPSACPPIAITFALGMSDPPPAAAPKMKALAEWMNAHEKATATIDGHADATGDEQANFALSRKRAKNLAAILERAGVQKERLTARGFGTYQPVEGAPEDASVNRRVHVMVKGADGCPAGPEEETSP